MRRLLHARGRSSIRSGIRPAATICYARERGRGRSTMKQIALRADGVILVRKALRIHPPAAE
jgi:hypothetical protein